MWHFYCNEFANFIVIQRMLLRLYSVGDRRATGGDVDTDGE